MELSVPIMQMSNGAWYKVTGIVTDRDLPGDDPIRWYSQRCGEGEDVLCVTQGD